jgi:hypothetical protein
MQCLYVHSYTRDKEPLHVITKFSARQIAFTQTDQVLLLHTCDQFNKTKACDIAN